MEIYKRQNLRKVTESYFSRKIRVQLGNMLEYNKDTV